MVELRQLKFVEDILVNARHRISVYCDEIKCKQYIIKRLSSGAEAEETRFLMRHEYEIASSLKGKNHIHPIELEDDGGNLAILYEDVNGTSLEEVTHQVPMEPASFFEAAIKLVEGLEQIHLQCVAHQDIKPSNIIVNLQKKQYYYNDFSLAKKWSRQEGKWVASGLGSAEYMSPEQTGRIDSYIDYRTDFYSLGATFYQILCGHPPFTTKNLTDLVHAHIARLPDPPHTLNHSVPEQLSSIILKMLAKAPKNRYQTAAGLKRDLIRCFRLWKENKSVISFPLGQKDKGGVFQIASGFYGRENEIETIKHITQEKRREFPLLVMVSGGPGSGKTSFVREVITKVEFNEGYFVQGKFDQYQRHRPLTAIASAFSQLFEKIYKKKGEDAKAWFLEIFGDNLPAITHIIPSLELLIGRQGKAVEVSPSDAQNRFAYNVSKIIEQISSEENPTVIFLDDLQWADAASLHLLYSLLTNTNCPGLIILGAYRDSEVDPAHSLSLTLHKLEKEGGSYNEITMGSLELEATTKLICDTLERQDQKTNELAFKLYTKSGGNPLLIRQLLITLYEKELINFDRSQLRWDWKEDEMATVQMDTHIVDLIIGKMNTLPTEAKKMLFLAASFGDEVELALLSSVMQLERGKAVAHVDKALGLGIIDYAKKDGKYRVVFCHDRFREACYQLIPKKQVAQEHKYFGMSLINLWNKEKQDENIFQITNLLNRAVPLLDKQERVMLARYNLKASEKALHSFAFKQGLQFVEMGISLLSESGWDVEYSLLFRLYENGIATSAELKEGDEIYQFFDVLVKNAKDPLETTQAHVRMIHYLYYLGDFNKSVNLARSFLNTLHFDYPKKGSKFVVLKEYIITRIIFWWNKITKKERPKLTNPRISAIIDIIEAVMGNHYYADVLLFGYGAIKIYQLMLIHGMHEREVCYRIAYFYLARVSFHDFSLPQSIFDEINIDKYKGSTFFPLVALTYLLGIRKYRPLTIANQQIEECFLYTLSMGNIVYSTALYGILCNHNLSASTSVKKSKRLIESYQDLTEKLGVLSLSWIAKSTLEFYNALISGEEYSVYVDGKRRNAKALFAWLESKGMHSQCFQLSSIVLLLALITTKDDIPWKYAQKGNPFQKTALGTSFKEDFYLYENMAIGLCFDKKNKNEQQKMRKLCRSNISELKQLMGLQYENYAHKYWLACGEYARMNGDTGEAHSHYQKGILLAKKNGFQQDTALALERCSWMMLSLKDHDLASYYMMKAIEFYDRWGAKAKVFALEQEYGYLFPEKEEKVAVRRGKSKTATITSEISDTIDIQAYIDAAAAISEVIDLENLMTVLVNVVLKNAGAEYVVLLTNKEGDWCVTAEKIGVDDEVAYLNLPLEKAADKVPLTIISDVISSKKEIVIKNALDDSKYNHDSYVIEYQSHSIMCLPLIYQNKMLAVLYLENSITEGAFTEERVKNILLLSSHIANALENALLYAELKKYSEDLEAKVKDRTKEIAQKNTALMESNDALNQTLEELNKTQKQLIASEKLASLGELTSGIAHEIRNPLHFINNFSTINIQFAEHNSNFFRQLDGEEVTWKEVSEELMSKQDMIVGNLKRILSYGKRLTEIVNMMEKHARVGRGKLYPTPISGLIERALAVATMDFTERFPDFTFSIDKVFDKNIDQVSVVSDEIDFVLSNVIKNAFEAMQEKSEENKTYNPHLIIHTEKIGDMVGIMIKDNGIGIEKGNLDSIFHPFYTTKPTGQAIGLALSISHMIVTSIHQGYINVASEPGMLTEVTISLPIGP